MLRAATDWLDRRTGHRRVLAAVLDEPVPGGASWAFVFGSVVSFILAIQLVTGVALALHYAPSVQTAWASVAYIQDQISLGWFVRGLHSNGSSALVIVTGLHMLQTAVYGAYKSPRELNWLVGVLMLALILAFALTGYLLPWDQKGYWATKVATGIAASTPLVGAKLERLMQGGNEFGNFTLTRFFVIHVILLPAALLALVAAHLALFRRHGITPRWNLTREALVRRMQRFWPDQMARDAFAMLFALGILVWMTFRSHGVELGAPADPASGYDARPEWYFLPLFEVLKHLEGWTETVVALTAPAAVLGLLGALPFVDRGPERSPRRRLRALLPLFAVFIAAGALIFVSREADARDAALQARLEGARRQAARARRLALSGVPPEGGTAVYENDPTFRGEKLFGERCAACHVGDERKGPALVRGYNSRSWLRDYLTRPGSEPFKGLSKAHRRGDLVPSADGDVSALAEMLYAQTGATDADPVLAARGRALFENGRCAACHSLEPEGQGGVGPGLGARGTPGYLAELIRDPGGARYFGARNEMPTFKDKLSADEVQSIAAYLASLRDAR